MMNGWSAKKVLIWALIMGFSSTLFGVEYGLIPGLILSWLISKAFDKYDAEHKEKNTKSKIDCQEYQTIENTDADYQTNSKLSLEKEIADVDAEPIIMKSNDDEENMGSEENDINNTADTKLEESFKVENANEPDKKIIYCRKCGIKLDLDAKYCRKCGTKIEE